MSEVTCWHCPGYPDNQTLLHRVCKMVSGRGRRAREGGGEGRDLVGDKTANNTHVSGLSLGPEHRRPLGKTKKKEKHSQESEPVTAHSL